MEVLSALGVDGTIVYQFAIFLVTYLFLYFLVFRPYSQALAERKNRTVGSEDLAQQFVEEAQGLEERYQTEARKVNLQIKDIFDAAKSKANRQYQDKVNAAKKQAQSQVEATKSQVAQQLEKARADVNGEAPALAKLISAKLLGQG